MAIKSVVIDRNSRKASISWPQGNQQYSVRFIVTSTEVLDGVETLGYPVDPDTGVKVPEPGDPFENIGNDTVRLLRAKSISVSQISGTVWAYDVTYGPPEISGGTKPGSTTNQIGETQPKDINGEPASSWDKIGPDINVQMVQRSRPAEKGAYIGKQLYRLQNYQLFPFQQQNLHPTLGPGPQSFAKPVAGGRLTSELENGSPIVNSAHKSFDPPIEVDYTRLLITVTRIHHKFPVNLLKFQDSVNKKPFRFNISGFNLYVPEFSCKMQGITGSGQWSAGDHWWRVDYVCEVDLYRGWRVDILDRGKTQLVQNDETRVWEDQLILDEKGHPINEPALLNGKGQPSRQMGSTSTQVGAYLRYAVYPERNFKPLRFDDPNP
tara:strand:- start:583 stop:1719 length:1137 start_codon:yes stop_codon:yes gene_type:complete